MVLAVVGVIVLLYVFVAMYSATQERRREIATMRALGARRATVLGIVLLGVREDQPHVRRVIPERPAATKLLREVPQKQPAFLDQRLRVADHIDIFLFARPKNHCWTRRGCRSEATPRTTTACNSAFLNPRSSSRPSTRVFFFETTLPMVAPVSEITDGQKIAAEVNLRQLKKLARSAGPDERLTALYDAGRQSLIIRSESSSASPLRRHFEARGGGELAQRYQLRVGPLRQVQRFDPLILQTAVKFGRLFAKGILQGRQLGHTSGFGMA